MATPCLTRANFRAFFRAIKEPFATCMWSWPGLWDASVNVLVPRFRNVILFRLADQKVVELLTFAHCRSEPPWVFPLPDHFSPCGPLYFGTTLYPFLGHICCNARLPGLIFDATARIVGLGSKFRLCWQLFSFSVDAATRTVSRRQDWGVKIPSRTKLVRDVGVQVLSIGRSVSRNHI
jgi:hypothetical protein